MRVSHTPTYTKKAILFVGLFVCLFFFFFLNRVRSTQTMKRQTQIGLCKSGQNGNFLIHNVNYHPLGTC